MLAKKNVKILFNLQALSIVNTSLSATENIRSQDVHMWFESLHQSHATLSTTRHAGDSRAVHDIFF